VLVPRAQSEPLVALVYYQAIGCLEDAHTQGLEELQVLLGLTMRASLLLKKVLGARLEVLGAKLEDDVR
jgi:hypothetical protein